MKKGTLISLCMMVMSCVFGQEQKFDPTAIMILDRMSDLIGSMTSCSFKTAVSHDVEDADFGLVKQFLTTQVYMEGPDKMLVNIWGPKSHRQCWYDGSQFAIYDYGEKNYGIIPAPSTIIATIDSIHAHFGLDLPAADFFYPAFTDDLLESNDRIAFLGTVDIDGQSCFQILAQNKDMTSQIWVSNDIYHLPIRYSITYTTKPGHPQYECTFSDWVVNPDIPNSIFNFLPPPDAHEVRLLSTEDQ